KNTPAEIVDRLNTEINAALADPKMKARFADLGGTVLPGSPADFGKLLADETNKWGKVIRTANIKAEGGQSHCRFAKPRPRSSKQAFNTSATSDRFDDRRAKMLDRHRRPERL